MSSVGEWVSGPYASRPPEPSHADSRTGGHWGLGEEEGGDVWAHWPWLQFTGADDRQSLAVASGPLVVGLVVGLAVLSLQLLQPVLSPVERPRLQNHPMCGITTGGQVSFQIVKFFEMTSLFQEECYWDCEIVVSQSSQVVSNLSCLQDCFPGGTTARQASDNSCLGSVLRDVIGAGGICSTQPGTTDIWGLTDTCDIKPDGCDNSTDPPICTFVPSILTGVCSAETEELMTTPGCQRAFNELPGIVQSTLREVIGESCVNKPFKLPDFGNYEYGDYEYGDYEYGDYGSGDYGQKHNRQKPHQRVAPVLQLNVAENYKTELDFTHTRHRYPWICSLRTGGATSEHLCAVTLLSVPPQPTVVVGAAHCTYLCKDEDARGRRLDQCCCTTQGQESCAEDQVRCGADPKAVEMTGRDAVILCGEWETGNATQDESEEKYNVVMSITEIIRHPQFDAAKEGPGEGSDIAVFKVMDGVLGAASRIYPACLPPVGRTQPTQGVHSGWTAPPPLAFLEKFASGYAEPSIYRDFFKQWHYKVDILEKCEDPTRSQTYGLALEYPSNSYYPPATICAKDITRQSCFSTGDSASPLMAREETRPMRFYIEGILSFVKGCDTFSMGPSNDDNTEFQLTQFTENPGTYTRLSCFLPWVASQYGLSYVGDPAELEGPVCNSGTGQREATQVCRQTISNLDGAEKECILPFYYKGKLYEECLLFEQEGFVYPVFRCPVRPITTMINGIMSYEEISTTEGYCVDLETDLLDPTVTDCFVKNVPFGTCKNDCPGGNLIS